METNSLLDFTNVANNNGYILSMVGLSIVFTTLIVISLFVATLPLILKLVDKCCPKKHNSNETTTEDEEIALAVGIVLNNTQK